MLGIAILVVILGDPTPLTAVTAFHHGWVLAICAFLGVAVVSLPLGRLSGAVEASSGVDERPPTVHAPLRADRAAGRHGVATPEAPTCPTSRCSRRCPLTPAPASRAPPRRSRSRPAPR